MSEHLLQVRDLRVSFDTAVGEIRAVRGVDFHLDRGETLCIVGESGCGKSVTVQTLMRLNDEPPAAIKGGEILYNGQDIAQKTQKEMRQYRGSEFAMIFQDAMIALNPTTKIGRQMQEAIRAHRDVSRQEARERILAMLEKVGLPDPAGIYDRFPHTLSGGQRQRVMIAMALCCRPSILLADEPTTALDVTIQAQILELMNQLKKDLNMGIIFITHNMGVVAKMADRIAVMYAGQVIESGTAEDVFYRPKHPYTWGLIGSMPSLTGRIPERLFSIPGTPPDLFAPPAGCGFAARCRHCMGVCTAHMPPEFEVTPGHRVRCWLLDERCQQQITPPCGKEPYLVPSRRCSDAD